MRRTTAIGIGVGIGVGIGACASVQRSVDRGDFHGACLLLEERDLDENRDALRPAFATAAALRWQFTLLSGEEATRTLGLPVAPGPHGEVVRIEVFVDAVPKGATSLDLHTPWLLSEGEDVPKPHWTDDRLATLLPRPAELTEVEVPQPYERAKFVPSEPAPELSYIPGSGREPAAAKAIRDVVGLMTLGLGNTSAPGPSLTPASRKALRRWQKKNKAEFDAWMTRENARTAKANAERNEAMKHNADVMVGLQRWQEDRERAQRALVEWPCHVGDLGSGESCQGLVFLPGETAGRLQLQFMLATTFRGDRDGCELVMSGRTAPANDLHTLLAPWSEPRSQHELAPPDYLTANFRL